MGEASTAYDQLGSLMSYLRFELAYLHPMENRGDALKKNVFLLNALC